MYIFIYVYIYGGIGFKGCLDVHGLSQCHHIYVS